MMMLDHIESRLWVAHGKALGDEVTLGLQLMAKGRRRLATRLLPLAQTLAALLAGAVFIGFAALPGVIGLGGA